MSIFRDRHFWLTFALTVLNLLVMHYTIFATCEMDNDIEPMLFVDNFSIVLIESVLLTTLASLFSWRNLRIGFLIAFFITWAWSIANIVYSRFFFQYIPFSAFSESGSLFDPLVMKSMLDGVKWVDGYFLVSAALAVWSFCKSPRLRLRAAYLWRTFLGVLAVILVNCLFRLIFYFTWSPSYYVKIIRYQLFTTWRYTCRPLYTNFQRGSVRNLAFAVWDTYFNEHELTAEERREITEELTALAPLQTSQHAAPDVKNVIIILVESYMSPTVGLTVDGKEVTPFLNALARDSSVYYNGHMASNITVGESSDGQLIYMTGLLPLRSEISIAKVKRHAVPGLPTLLSKTRGMHTRMVIPTAMSMWSQDDLCKQYGIADLYSLDSYQKPHGTNLTDAQVFEMADSIDATTQKPFFSVVLTMATHMPYFEQMDPSFPIRDPKLPDEFKVYLNACHYTDAQIARYFANLKRRGLFDESLILILSDHNVKPEHLAMPASMERELPVYIINGGFSRNEAWGGACNQLDVYTTILDLLKIEAPWRGLGHTLLTTDYQNSVSDDSRKWDYSEWMISGNYFNQP